MRPLNGKILAIDMDGVLAEENGKDYSNASPYIYAIEQVNKAYDMGFYIKLHTARYMFREHNDSNVWNRGYLELTEWANKYFLKYDEIVMAKTSAHLYVDNNACRVESQKGNEDWDNNFWPKVMELCP